MSKDRNLLVIAISLMLWSQLYAWDHEYTHPAITRDAIDRSVLGQDYLQVELSLNGLGVKADLSDPLATDITNRIAAVPDEKKRAELKGNIVQPLYNWLADGSMYEDIPNPRARHHFYDPIDDGGLDNWDVTNKLVRKKAIQLSKDRWPKYNGFTFIGNSSLKTALADDIVWQEHDPDIGRNQCTWPDARWYYEQAITVASEEQRGRDMANAFCILGHVCHLLQDAGVPAHVRNDFTWGHLVASLPWIEDKTKVDKALKDAGNPFEAWVTEQIGKNKKAIPERWLDETIGNIPSFSEIAQYWDKEICNATGYQWQGHNEGWPDSGFGKSPPLKEWGLAEAGNYQFLSFSTIFKDNGSTPGYPHPARDNTREYSDDDGFRKYYLGGYGVPHLARVTYTHKLAARRSVTLPRDITFVHHPTVFKDYANITIPRTINYTTGLINYFFRGRLRVKTEMTEENDAILTIKNISMNGAVEQTLHNGEFTLYWEDQAGERTQITYPDFKVYQSGSSTVEWNSHSELGFNETTDAVFSSTFLASVDPEDVNQYILIFKGNISAEPGDPDTNDENAIAAKTFQSPAPLPETPEGGGVIVVAGERKSIGAGAYASIWFMDHYGNELCAPHDTGGDTHRCIMDSDGYIYVVGQQNNAGDNIWKFSPEFLLLNSVNIGTQTLQGDNVDAYDIVEREDGSLLVVTTAAWLEDYFDQEVDGHCYLWLLSSDLSGITPVLVESTPKLGSRVAIDTAGNIFVGGRSGGDAFLKKGRLSPIEQWKASRDMGYKVVTGITVMSGWNNDNIIVTTKNWEEERGTVQCLNNHDLSVRWTDMRDSTEYPSDEYTCSYKSVAIDAEDNIYASYSTAYYANPNWWLLGAGITKYNSQGERIWERYNDSSGALFVDNIGKLWSSYERNYDSVGNLFWYPYGESSAPAVDIWGFATATGVPGIPVPMSPIDGESNVHSSKLTWYTQLGALSYDVYVNGQFRLNTASNSVYLHEMGTEFEYDQNYTWEIVAKNPLDSISGGLWSFTTETLPLPGEPIYATPPYDGQTGVPVDVLLAWGSIYVDNYDVYFNGILVSPSQTGNTYSPGPLDYDTVYNFQIIARNMTGVTAGPVWSFCTTAGTGFPPTPIYLEPENGGYVWEESAILAWEAQQDVTGYDVYFGPVSTGAVLVSENQTPAPNDPEAVNVFEVTGLIADEEYEWRIESINATGTTPGPTWTFTRMEEPGE